MIGINCSSPELLNESFDFSCLVDECLTISLLLRETLYAILHYICNSCSIDSTIDLIRVGTSL